MAIQLPISSAAVLKQELELTLTPWIGQYKRPNLPNIAAIRVLDSPTPDGYKVICAKPTESVIPALEVLINYAPEYQTRTRNIYHRAIDEGWRVWLVFHDSRQDPCPVLRSIERNFDYAGEISYLPDTKNFNAQYNLLIINKLTVEQS